MKIFIDMTTPLRLLWLVLTLLILSGCAGLPPVRVDAPLPSQFPQQGFSHDSFEKLLQRFVKDGRVDYAAWHADKNAIRQMDSYIAAIAAFSPENAPERFPKENDRKAYWLYTYNALVIKAVLDRWPLDSVNDVKSSFELVQGYGFFYQQQFVVGGKVYNLYDIEHQQVFGKGSDPRAHFVLNCASGSCPLIKPELPTGDALEPYLVKVTEEFLSDPRNVHIDHPKRNVNLSMIFKWYAEDFINDLHRRGLPSTHGVLDYLLLVAPPGLRSHMQQALEYSISYEEYDWSINKVSP